MVLEYMNRKDRFRSAKNKIYAYWVNQVDDDTQETAFVEDYDDDGEEGAGEKLLHLL